MNRRAAVTACALSIHLLGCTGFTSPLALDQRLQGLTRTPLLLLGEQHDAPEHQQLQRDTVRHLAERGRLAAVVMEMVEQGRQTTGLPADADENRVRRTLNWSDERPGAWPWPVYRVVVMEAVRAGVPVLGGNLPRDQMRAAMADGALDGVLAPGALQGQRESIRDGHCGLLPESQVAPMTRIQLARDRAMAQAAVAALRPGQTVLLVAGNQHVRRDLGVPQHLPKGQPHRVVMALPRATDQPDPASAAADQVLSTPPRPPRDHCAEMKTQIGK